MAIMEMLRVACVAVKVCLTWLKHHVNIRCETQVLILLGGQKY